MQENSKVNIRPSVSIIGALKHLNYKAWFALAEFVDNAIDSYYKYEKELKLLEGQDFKLRVDIDINLKGNIITIKDNAAGIHQKDFERALKTAEIPPTNMGLSEFGMGMKSASCWFSNYWTVKTTAIGEIEERTVTFDVAKIVEEQIETLEVTSKPVEAHLHGTLIELQQVYETPKTGKLTKIKNHLRSIYRDFFRLGVVELYFNGELLSYVEPKILNAPFFKNLENESVLWKLEIPSNFVIRDNLSITKGFIAIREVGSTSEAGLALFRRGRVILGSSDEGFRPEELFGSSNSYRYQRVFGELHLEGFEVSHTKDGFKNDGDIQDFIKILAEILNDDFQLLKQAEGYRARKTDNEYKEAAQKVIKNTVEIVSQSLAKPIQEIIDTDLETEENEKTLSKISGSQSTHEIFEIRLNAITWRVSVELSWNSNALNWIEIGDKFIREQINGKSKGIEEVGIRLALKHPFCENFAGADKSRLTPLIRLAVAIGLSEVLARGSGIQYASTFTQNINKLLTDSLSAK